MTWIRLDDTMPAHPKVATISDTAFRLYITSLCHCGQYLTDGVVTVAAIPRAKPGTVRELLKAGLFDKTKRGIEVHNFLAYQPTAAEVRETREKKRAAGAAGGNAKAANALAKDLAPASGLLEELPYHLPSHPLPSHPIPEKEGTTSSSDLSSKGNGEEIFPHTSDDGGLCFVPASAVADFDDPEHGFGLAEIEAVMKQLEQDTAADPSKRRPKEAAITTARNWIRTALKIRDRDRAKAPAGIVGSHGAGDVFVGEAGSVERAAHLSRIVIHKNQSDLDREAEGDQIRKGREADTRRHEKEIEDDKVLNEIFEEKRKAKAEAAP